MEEKEQVKTPVLELQVEELELRIAPSAAGFPPGQFPAGNPHEAPGDSNPQGGQGNG